MHGSKPPSPSVTSPVSSTPPAGDGSCEAVILGALVEAADQLPGRGGEASCDPTFASSPARGDADDCELCGSIAAATRPIRPTVAKAIIATPYARPGVAVMPATRMVPAMAVPRLDSRGSRCDYETDSSTAEVPSQPAPWRVPIGRTTPAPGHRRGSRSDITQKLLSAANMPVTHSTRPIADRIAPLVSNGRVGSAGSGSVILRLNK